MNLKPLLYFSINHFFLFLIVIRNNVVPYPYLIVDTSLEKSKIRFDISCYKELSKSWGSLKVVAILNYTNLLKRRPLYKDTGKINVKLSYFDCFFTKGMLMVKNTIYHCQYHLSKLKADLMVNLLTIEPR